MAGDGGLGVRGRSGTVVNAVIALALLLVVGLTVVAIRGSGGTPTDSEAQTANVSTGDVTATVSANGNVAAGTTVNADFQGRVYPPTETYRVSAAKIREFAEAVGSSDPVHVDTEVARARGYADVIAPPTFAVIIAQQYATSVW